MPIKKQREKKIKIKKKSNKNIQKQKPSHSKSKLCGDNSPCLSVSETSLNMNLDEATLTNFNQDNHQLDDPKCANHFKSSINAYSKSESRAVEKEYFFYEEEATKSQWTTVKSKRKKEYSFLNRDDASKHRVHKESFLSSSDVAASKGDSEYQNVLADECIESLDYMLFDACYEDIDAPESVVNASARKRDQDLLKSPNISKESVNATSKSQFSYVNKAFFKEETIASKSLRVKESFIKIDDASKPSVANQGYFLPSDKANSSEVSSNTSNIYSESPNVSTDENMRLLKDSLFVSNCQAIFRGSEIKVVFNSRKKSVSLNDDINDFLRQDTSSTDDKLARFRDGPSDITLNILSNKNNILQLIKLRIVEIFEKYIQDLNFYNFFISWSEDLFKSVIAKKIETHKKSRRNACIQTIYKMKFDETMKGIRKLSYHANDFLMTSSEVLEFQKKMLNEVIEKFVKNKSNEKIVFRDEYCKVSSVVMSEFFKETDFSQARRMEGKKSTLETNMKKIKDLSDLLLEP